MTDVFTKEKRSSVMAAIRSTGNRATELLLARIFRSYGLTGWRRHVALPGRPDFVFRKARLAIFVDGCFWHGCPSHFRAPRSNVGYWNRKIARNKKRSVSVNAELRRSGWRVLRIWQHQLKNEGEIMQRILKLWSTAEALNNS
jgi:DNA mismatch endonuclease (patch repair protein)